jgi:hypothetical protein
VSIRSSIFGGGGVGGKVEYRGDVPAPVQSYASALPNQPLTSRLFTPGASAWTRSAVVSRSSRTDGLRMFYVHGATRQPVPLVRPGVGAGGVESSAWQQNLVLLTDWCVNTAWLAAGYPRNFGWTFRGPQPQTNVTGGPGKSRQTQRPLLTRVQSVRRASVTVQTYPTRGAGS